MSFRYVAGVLGKTVTPSGPYQNSTAPGIWSLAGQANFKAQGLWPTQGNEERLLYAWGLNDYGQLGLNNTVNKSSPTQVNGISNWLLIASGNDHNIAITTTGQLYAWGNGNAGSLGLGNSTYYSTPKQVGTLSNWVKVSAGFKYSAAIKTDGTLWIWGSGSLGKNGLGNTTSYSSPKQIGSLTNWSKIALGNYHALAVKTDGTLWTWGYNEYGQLGLGNSGAYTDRSSPVQVGVSTSWAAVSVQANGSFAVTTTGQLYSWGQNAYGRLGLNDTTNRSSPVQVGTLTNWLKVSAGSYFTTAVKTDGTLWSWGQNQYGQLGLNNTTYYSSPKQVGSLTTWLQISAIYRSGVTSIKTNGTLWLWGRNQVGQLGLGNVTSYSSPKQVGVSTNWNTLSVNTGGKDFVMATTI